MHTNKDEDFYIKEHKPGNLWYASYPLGTGENLGEMYRRAKYVRTIGFHFFSRAH